MKSKLKYLFVIAICSLSLLQNISAQDVRATSFEIEESEQSAYGALFVTVGKTRKKVADYANLAWLIGGGREVVYSSNEGAGGFENEGQSLHIYDVKTVKTRKIMSQYTMIVGLTEKRLSNGKTVLLVRLEDGGLGGSYFSVVDPTRGEIFYRSLAELTASKGDTITLNFYKDEDWGNILEQRGEKDYQNRTAIPSKVKVKPTKTEAHDLKKILTNKVIFNKPTNVEPKMREVKIYLWRVNENVRNKNFVLGTVTRTVEADAPLRPTLEELFLWNNETEENKGFSSSTFGMKFEGAVLKKGTTTIKFSQPPDQTNYGSLAPFILQEAVEKTAKQFPTVKKVEICAIGETLIDAQSEKPFPRCAK